MALRRKGTDILNLTTVAMMLIGVVVLMISCGKASVPTDYKQTDCQVSLYPDYVGVTIPCNISPLNFIVRGHESEECVASMTCDGKTMCAGGTGRICWDEDEWHSMLSSAKGKDIIVKVFVKGNDRKWIAFKPFSWTVAEEIDRYVSYRLIPPSYTCYEELSICQRDLTSFEESVIYSNRNDAEGQNHCINCHNFQNYDTKRMQFHIRGKNGGTVIYDNGVTVKRDLKRKNTLSAGVYPAWHPSLDLIAYSTNKTMQHFQGAGQQKVEVQDTHSEIILYDVKKDKVIPVTDTPKELEVFPSWSPDGKTLYYCSAQVEDTTKQWICENYKNIRYNIYRRSFDADRKAFGEAELINDGDGQSVLLPRISPDGRYLLYSRAPFGVFHIWHEEADIWVTELTTNRSYPLTAANSKRADSYHNWSSNGRWIVLTSRRNDGNFTRLYFAYFDKNGKAHKAFELPQENPGYELRSLKGYNVPEFSKTVAPKFTAKDF